jgi:hypothetical protein
LLGNSLRAELGGSGFGRVRLVVLEGLGGIGKTFDPGVDRAAG